MVIILANTKNFNSFEFYFLSVLFIILKLQPFCRSSVCRAIVLLLICDIHTNYNVEVLFTLPFYMLYSICIYLHMSCFHLEYSQISMTWKTTCAVPTVTCIGFILDRSI
jgi:hypothetical protein